MQIYTDNSYIIYIYKAVHTVLEVCDAHATHFSFISYKNCCTLELISAQIWYQVLSSVLLNSESSGWNIEQVPRNFIHVFIHSELKFQFVLNKLLYSLDQTKYFNIYRKTAEGYWKLAASPLMKFNQNYCYIHQLFTFFGYTCLYVVGNIYLQHIIPNLHWVKFPTPLSP